MKMYSKSGTLRVHWTRTQGRGAVLRLSMDYLQLLDLSVDSKRRAGAYNFFLQTTFWSYFGSLQANNQPQLARGDLRTASRPGVHVQCTRKVPGLLLRSKLLPRGSRRGNVWWRICNRSILPVRRLRRKTKSDQNSKTWLLYARINCQNKFVAPDELPAVQAASESTVARVQTSAAARVTHILGF